MRRACVLGALIVVAVVCADDGWQPAVGGSIAPWREHPSVRLADEQVFIDILPSAYAVVDAHFHFVATKPIRRVRAAFPVRVDEGHGGCTLLSIEVDGRRVAWREVAPVLSNKRGPVSYTVHYVHWIDFTGSPPEARVHVRYGQALGMISTATHNWMTYILTSGRTWHGTIGRAEFRFHIRGPWEKVNIYRPHRLRKLELSERGQPYDKRQQDAAWPGIKWIMPQRLATLTMENFEPDDDIEIQLITDPQWDMYDAAAAPFNPWQEPVPFKPGGRLVWMYFARGLRDAAAYAGDAIPQLAWDGASKTLTIRRLSRWARLRIGSREMQTSAGRVELPAAPYLCRGSAVVPLIPVCRALGLKVFVDNKRARLRIASRPPFTRWRELWHTSLDSGGADVTEGATGLEWYIADGSLWWILSDTDWQPGDRIQVALRPPQGHNYTPISLALLPSGPTSQVEIHTGRDVQRRRIAFDFGLIQPRHKLAERMLYLHAAPILKAAGLSWRLSRWHDVCGEALGHKWPLIELTGFPPAT